MLHELTKLLIFIRIIRKPHFDPLEPLLRSTHVLVLGLLVFVRDGVHDLASKTKVK